MADMKKKTPVLIPAEKGDQSFNGTKARNVQYGEITNVPLAVYLTKAGRFLNTVPAVQYDTAVYEAAVITPQHVATLFVKGTRQQDATVNVGTAYTKSKVQTNMTGNGEFEGGETFILEEINVDLFLLSDKVTTVGNGGEIQSPVLTAQANYSASAHYYAITRQFELAFLRNEQVMITGRLHEFPNLFLASGAFGNDEGFIQNGFGRLGWNKLPRARVLESLDKFSFELRPLASTFTPQVGFNICVNMVGKLIKPLFE